MEDAQSGVADGGGNALTRHVTSCVSNPEAIGFIIHKFRPFIGEQYSVNYGKRVVAFGGQKRLMSSVTSPCWTVPVLPFACETLGDGTLWAVPRPFLDAMVLRDRTPPEEGVAITICSSRHVI